MVNWKVYKSIFDFNKYTPLDKYDKDNYENEDGGFTFKEFKERMIKSMEREFGGELKDGDIIGHDGYPPFYLWIAEGMYLLNGITPEEILWNYHDSRSPEDIIDYFETYPNLFYRYYKVGDISNLDKIDWNKFK